MNLIERAATRIAGAPPGSLLERAEAQGMFATLATSRGLPPQGQAIAPEPAPVRPATGASAPRMAFDRARLAAAGYVLPEGPHDRLAEEMRIIRQRLAAHGASPPGSVMVTSARPGEGKTFFALNLALGAARDEGRPIVLVDGDLRRQGLSRALGLGESPGIQAALAGEADLDACLLRVDDLPLMILPAGRIDPAAEPPTEPQIRGLVERIAAGMPDCLVVYDAPPMLAATEPILLAPHVDRVLFVVEADRTPERAVASALDLLSSTEHVSMVLNKAPARRGGDTFGGYDYAPTGSAGRTVRS